MNYIADLHIHSPFSRATSPESSPAGLVAWARLKGIHLIGTGDCTHPGWLRLLKEQLEPAEPGLYRLKADVPVPSVVPGLDCAAHNVRFLLSAEISSIYKRGGATRKVHNLLYLPDFASVEKLNARLAGIGNIESDGRPILGLDSRNLLEILLECSPEAFLVPAHIWTPWFSLFGSKSGFNSIEECFGDLSDQIFALETGLSSDPDMNRLISGLDHCALISNSDCHSPSKLGREANIFNTGFDFYSLREALRRNKRDTFCGTIEFFPEEGKYHFDGHRECNVCLDPYESKLVNNICPACNRPLTIGVHNRVLELADRVKPYYPSDSPAFHSLIPLPEILSELLQVGVTSKQVSRQYARAISRFGTEFHLLLNAEADELAEYEPLLSEAVTRMRQGRVIRKPGYDGAFGVIRVFEPDELAQLAGQFGLFNEQRVPRKPVRSVTATDNSQEASSGHTAPAVPPQSKPEQSQSSVPNQEQFAAIQAEAKRILVAAGPGTGKTFTLVARIRRLLDEGVDPATVVAITFTTKTAEEMQARLGAGCGISEKQMFIGTFHRFCLDQLRDDNPELTVVGPESRQRLIKRLYPGKGGTERGKLSHAVTAYCSGSNRPASEEVQLYIDELMRLNAIDLDAIIPVCVQMMRTDDAFMQRITQRTRYLFVDEFQDVNRAQYELVELLAAEGATVFAIGDPDQAIYGFRGGDLRYFFKFAEVSGTLLLPLKTTYRLPQKIVQSATTLISRNLIRSGLPLTAVEQCPDGHIEFHRVLSPSAEAELIVHRIEELIGGIDSFSHNSGRIYRSGVQQDLTFADFAILFRLGRQAEELADALSRRGIPYQLVGATPFYQSPTARPLYYLLLAANQTDEIATWLALLGCLKGVGLTTLDRLEAELPLKGDFLHLVALLEQPQAVRKAVAMLDELLQSFRHQIMTTGGITAGLQYACVQLALDPEHEDIHRLSGLAVGFGADLARFCTHLEQYASATVYDAQAEAVALMSCHSAKGLEFPVVFMAGLEEGIFPCTLMGPPYMEEERRLFYVGMTRSRYRLIMTASTYRTWIGQGGREMSRFITELPAELVEHPLASGRKKNRQKSNTQQMDLF